MRYSQEIGSLIHFQILHVQHTPSWSADSSFYGYDLQLTDKPLCSTYYSNGSPPDITISLLRTTEGARGPVDKWPFNLWILSYPQSWEIMQFYCAVASQFYICGFCLLLQLSNSPTWWNTVILGCVWQKNITENNLTAWLLLPRTWPQRTWVPKLLIHPTR